MVKNFEIDARVILPVKEFVKVRCRTHQPIHLRHNHGVAFAHVPQAFRQAWPIRCCAGEFTPRMWKTRFTDNPMRSDIYRPDVHNGTV